MPASRAPRRPALSVSAPVVTLTDLGTLGGASAWVAAISDSGWVVGWTETGTGIHAAYLWRNGVVTDLGIPSGAAYFTPTGVNDSGQVVGGAGVAGGKQAFTWTNGVFAELPTLDHWMNTPGVINNAGQVAVTGHVIIGSTPVAFLVTRGQMVSLGTLGGSESDAYGLNDSGVVSGYSTLAGDADGHAFIWRAGAMHDLGTLGGTYSAAYAINNAGIVVGLTTLADGSYHGFEWSNGTMSDFGSDFQPAAINSSGQVVGATMSGDRQAILWAGGTATVLPCPASTSDCAAVAINDKGQAVGNAVIDGAVHALLWTLGSANRPPVAVAGSPYGGREGESVAFSGAGSSDPDGDPLTYTWAFGDGATATGATPTHVYADNGNYTATLVVSDGSLADTAAVAVSISNVPPSVTAGADATIYSGDSYSFSGTFHDPGILDRPWTYGWYWGDGSYSVTSTTPDQSLPITGTHRYLKAGTYSVLLAVTDKDGGTGRGSLALTVLRIPVTTALATAEVKLNDRGQGLLTVDVLGTPGFDATAVNPWSVTLGDEHGTDTPVAQRGQLMASVADVNGDGILDMVLHFDRSALIANGDLSVSTTRLVLLGDLKDGRQIRGVVPVAVRP